jgi:hypothetical protein
MEWRMTVRPTALTTKTPRNAATLRIASLRPD